MFLTIGFAGLLWQVARAFLDMSVSWFIWVIVVGSFAAVLIS